MGEPVSFTAAHDAKMWRTLNREQQKWLVGLLEKDAQVIAGLSVQLARTRRSWWARLRAWTETIS